MIGDESNGGTIETIRIQIFFSKCIAIFSANKFGKSDHKRKREGQFMGTEDRTESHQVLLGDPDFLRDLRAQMLKFATVKLGDASLAEDVVQEALIAAFKFIQSFDGRSALKTWVFAILKNKIIDALRKKQQLSEVDLLLHHGDDNSDLEKPFDQNGAWQHDQRPKDWGGPELVARDQDFWRVFEACLEHLPGQHAMVFMYREFIGMESKEICDVVGIGVSNLHVILYRARMRLRECLENNWFLEGESTC